ncbi:MAG: hypothetical protein ACRD0D_12955 [Acidimicrobiales bacterium]
MKGVALDGWIAEVGEGHIVRLVEADGTIRGVRDRDAFLRHLTRGSEPERAIR